MSQPFYELGLLLLIAAGFGVIAVRLRQPVLIAYIIVGIVAGPAVMGLVTAQDQIDLLAQMGIAVLLFLVGLKLDLQHVRHIGPVALATGLGQLAFTIIIGFALILLMGRDWLTALYVAVALTFSSTIIIVKLLSDKNELDSLHGRIAVGFLIVQDIAVVLAMMVMSTLRTETESAQMVVGLETMQVIGSLVLRISLAAALLYVFMRFILPPLVERMAKSQELLLVFAVAWGTALAALGEWAGFSKEAGAFLAGFSLASTHYRDAISARLIGLRDFLLLFFFVDLGAKLDFTTLTGELWPAIILSCFVLIGNPLIVMAIMGYMGYRKRTGFMAGLTVAQISEFSIVFVAMGISLGHINQEALGLTTLVGLVTIAVSTYMILYSQPLFERLSPWLDIFERRQPRREQRVEQQRQPIDNPRIVIFGLGRYGRRLLERLSERDIPVLGIDFDPELIRTLRRRKLPVRFGDAGDPFFLESLPLAGADWIVTTLPELSTNRMLFSTLNQQGVIGKLAGLVRDDHQQHAFREAGVTRVMNPFSDGADHVAAAFIQEFEVGGSSKPS